MIGTCWSSSLLTSLISSADRPVSLWCPAPSDFRDVITANVGTARAEAAAARVRKERLDGAASLFPASTTIGATAESATLRPVFELRILSLLLADRGSSIAGLDERRAPIEQPEPGRAPSDAVRPRPPDGGSVAAETGHAVRASWR